MVTTRVRTRRVAALLALGLAAAPMSTAGLSQDHPPSELVGVWRGTSVCTDRVAAPACNDEVIVYELSATAAAGVVHWLADKIVDGKRVTMGESELTYSASEGCWRTEFRSPRVQIVWCLTAKGDQLTGSAWLLPGKQVVRKVEARKQ